MKNRRNFYRILHVQPEAPLEVIKASYRSLMSKLKAHPDLGGDHEAAVLINQAYEVLSHPEKRRRYDQTLRPSKVPLKPDRPATPDSPLRPRYANTYGPRSRPQASPPAAAPEPYAQCPFCGTPASGPRRADARCGGCASPLALRLAAPGTHMRELFGRRTAPRIQKADGLTLYPGWPHRGHPAQLRDVSSTGLRLLSHHRPQVGEVVKIEGRLLDGIVRIVSVRASAGAVSIHASFLTAELVTKAGAFVSEKA